MSEFTQAFELHNMVPGPAGVAVVQVMYKSEDGILDCYGTTKPADAATGFATGCLFRKTDGSDGSALYLNEGDAASADFNLVVIT